MDDFFEDFFLTFPSPARRRAPATATTSTGRLPVGAPQTNLTGPYSHIQIVAKSAYGEPWEEGGHEADEGTPTFSSPSYQQILASQSAAAKKSPTEQADARTASSGHTFADMARAAALSDSRELYEGEPPPTAGPVPLSGLIKFKTTNRNKGSRIWKPLDLRDTNLPKENFGESSLDQPMRYDSTDPATQQQSADVKAPQPDFTFGNAYNTLATLRTNEADVPSGAKPAMDPFAALSRHMHEVTEAFGEKLSGPDFLQQNVGAADGEVHFIQHPNGDVSAHQWSSSSFQWINIGQYSYTRRRIEGQLASERLRGQSADAPVPPSTIHYFRAAARQREEALASKRNPDNPAARDKLGMEDPRAPAQHRPKLQLTTTDDNSGRFASLSSAGVTSQGVGLPGLKAVHANDQVNLRNHSTTQATRIPVFGSLPDDPFVNSADKLNKSVSAYEHYSDTVSPASQDPGRLDFTFRFPPQSPASQHERRHSLLDNDVMDQERKLYYAQQEQARIRQTLWPQQRVKESLRDVSVGEEAASAMRGPPPGLGFDTNRQYVQPESSSQRKPQTSSGRELMMEYLNRLGASTAERSTEQKPQRTVLYDPLQAMPTGLVSREVQSQAVPHTIPNLGHPMSKHLQSSLRSAEQPPTSSGSLASGNTLRASDPEPGWRDRPVDVRTLITTPSNLSNEELAMVKPLAQDFRGPFFNYNVPTTHEPLASLTSNRPHAEEVDEWWRSGRQRERQEDFYRSLQSLNTGSKQAGKESEPAISRLLIPLYENLASYVQGPNSTRHDYFARFGAPPEWCIDRTARGVRSFFGEDWGAPPQRVGRDPRYRPFAHEPRYAMLDEQERGGLPSSRFRVKFGAMR